MGWLDSWRSARAEQGLRAMPEQLGRELRSLQDSIDLLNTDLAIVETPQGSQLFLSQCERFIVALQNISEHLRLITHWRKQHPEIPFNDELQTTVKNTLQISLQAITEKKIDRTNADAIVNYGKKIINDAQPLLTTTINQEEGIATLKKYMDINEYSLVVIQFAKEHPYDFKMLETSAEKNAHDLFRDGLHALENAGLLTRENWPWIVEFGKAAGTNVAWLFYGGLPTLAYAGLLTHENRLLLLELGESAGTKANLLFTNGLPKLAKQGLLTPENWPWIVELGKSAGTMADDLFRFGLPTLAKQGLLTPENWPWIVELVKSEGTNAGNLFEFGLPALAEHGLFNRRTAWWLVALGNRARKNQYYFYKYVTLYSWKTIDELKIVGKVGVNIVIYTSGTESQIRHSLAVLKDSRDYFGMSFPEFELAIAKSQRVATFLIFRQVFELFALHCLRSVDDLNVIVKVCNQYKPTALTIIKEVIVEGKKQDIIHESLSEESEVLFAFLKETPAYILSLYIPFKRLWQGNTPDKDQQVTMLFKDGRELLRDIKDGTMRRDYPEELLFGVLYSVFACNDMTVPKENYIHTFNERKDRQDDVPKAFWRPFKVSLSRGGYILRDETSPVQQDAWNALVNIAGKIKDKKEVNIAQLGFSMLAVLGTDEWKNKRAFFLEQVYQIFVNSGEHLPEFRLDHSCLMSYKEFVGDRLPNDLLPKIFQECLATNAEQFISLQAKFTGRTAPDTSQLAGFLNDKILNNNRTQRTTMPDEKKIEVIKKVLAQNKLAAEENAVEDIMRSPDVTTIKKILDRLSGSIIDKALITKTHLALYGVEYEYMRREMGKYDFKNTEGEEKYTFLLSKRKMHCCAMYNMGVCVAPDNSMWNSPDMWQLITFDEQGYAHGGTIMRTIMHDKGAYLVLSIQPAGSLLSQASPEAIFDKTIQYARIITKQLHYRGILIPTNSAIHSNRGSMQDIIAKRYGQTTPLKTASYQFSNSPSYPYDEFYQVA